MPTPLPMEGGTVRDIPDTRRDLHMISKLKRLHVSQAPLLPTLRQSHSLTSKSQQSSIKRTELHRIPESEYFKDDNRPRIRHQDCAIRTSRHGVSFSWLPSQQESFPPRHKTSSQQAPSCFHSMMYHHQTTTNVTAISTIHHTRISSMTILLLASRDWVFEKAARMFHRRVSQQLHWMYTNSSRLLQMPNERVYYGSMIPSSSKGTNHATNCKSSNTIRNDIIIFRLETFFSSLSPLRRKQHSF